MQDQQITNTEIERKFLVTDDSYKLLSNYRYDIVQGYICKDEARTVRIRLRTEADGTGKGYITIKSKPSDNHIAHLEWEKEIDVPSAQLLLQICLPGLIEKTRWIIPARTTPDTLSLIWEVDEFHGRLNGLVMAEIELNNEQQPFLKPSFIGEEVTFNPKYYNANM